MRFGRPDRGASAKPSRRRYRKFCSPQANRWQRHAGLLRDLGVGHTISGPQHDPGPQRLLLRRRRRAQHSPQLPFLLPGKFDSCRRARHDNTVPKVPYKRRNRLTEHCAGELRRALVTNLRHCGRPSNGDRRPSGGRLARSAQDAPYDARGSPISIAIPDRGGIGRSTKRVPQLDLHVVPEVSEA